MKEVTCPICGRTMRGQPREWPDWPFCGSRCRLIDLGRWLGEDYRLPAQAVDSQAADADTEDIDADPPKPAGPSAVPNREEA
jgi:uncharacterized protein